MGPAKRPISGLLSVDYPMISVDLRVPAPPHVRATAGPRRATPPPRRQTAGCRRCRSGRVSPGNRPISTRYATHAFCSASIGPPPMIRHTPWSSRVGPDSNTSGRPQRRAHSLSAWRLGRARRVPVFGRVGPPRRRVCRDRRPARTCGLGASCGAPTGGVRPLLPPLGPRLRAGAGSASPVRAAPDTQRAGRRRRAVPARG